jgi:hypothetical protein
MHHFPISATKKCSEGTKIHELWENHCKNDESTDSRIERGFPGMLPKALGISAKVCHCPRELH